MRLSMRKVTWCHFWYIVRLLLFWFLERSTNLAEITLSENCWNWLKYSHFSLVRTISGKEKILYYRELLVSEKFFETRWSPLVLPSPVILGEIFFTLENYLLVRNFCLTLGFPCGFTVSAESPVWFGRKSIITLFFKFIHWFKICLTRIVQ